MKQPLFQMILKFFVLFSCSLAWADDFIKMDTQQVWKVQECVQEGNDFKVKVCYSSQYCESKYPSSQYSCEKSLSCGDNYLNGSNLAKGKVKLVKSLKSFDGAYYLTLPAEVLNQQLSKSSLASSGWRTSIDFPVVIYSSRQTADEKALKEKMKKSGIPNEALLFSVTKINGGFSLVPSTNNFIPLSPQGQNPTVGIDTKPLVKMVQDLLSQELSTCPD